MKMKELKMMKIIASSILLMFAHKVCEASPHPHPVKWTPISFKKIAIPTNSPEGIIFEKNKNKSKLSYSMSYFIGSKIINTRAIPVDTYESMIKDLHVEVFNGSTRNPAGLCAEMITLDEGNYSKSKINNVKSKKYCLNEGRNAKSNRANFVNWYSKARSILGL
jgi:hypothetical protein